MNRHRRRRSAVWILFAALLAAGCSAPQTAAPTGAAPSGAAATPAGPTGTLSIALPTLGSESQIPRLMSGSEAQIALLWGDTLIGNDPKTRKPVPRLAESWSVDVGPSGAAWTFKLRANVPFNEGQGTLTAEDVKFTYRLHATQDKIGGNVLGPLIDNDLNNFEVVGPLEFKLRSKSLNIAVPELLSSVAGIQVTIVPKAYYEKVGEKGWDDHPIGTGPFVFKSHTKGDRFLFEAVPNHWRKTASVKTLTVLVVPEDSTRLAMLKSGQVDLTPLPSRFKKEMSADLKLYSVHNGALVYMPLGGMFPGEDAKNCLPPKCPWGGSDASALKVREAMTIAIDRKAIIDRLLFGEGIASPAPWVWAPGPFAFNDPSWTVPAYDAQRAKQLLGEAGYPSGFPIKLAIFSLAGFPEQEDVGEAVAGYWEALGLRVERVKTEFRPTFSDIVQARNTAGYAWVNNVPFQDEPIRNLTPSYSKSKGRAFLYDPKIDQYLDTAPREPDLTRRMALARELGDVFVKQRLQIPLFSANSLYAASARLQAWDIVQGNGRLHNVETIVFGAK